MKEVSEAIFKVRWSDLDPNFHLRHSVYADYCAAMRMDALTEMGFGYAEFAKYQIGPVLFKETLTYLKEIRPGDKVKVNVKLGGMSEDGRKFCLFHEILSVSSGEVAATLEVRGAWMNTVKRKVEAPPADLLKVLQSFHKVSNFETL